MSWSLGSAPSLRRYAGHLIREIAPQQGKPRFRSPSTPGRITSYGNPSSRLREVSCVHIHGWTLPRGTRDSFHVVVDELNKKRANRDGPMMRRAPENSASSTVIPIASVVYSCVRKVLARASPYRFPGLCAVRMSCQQHHDTDDIMLAPHNEQRGELENSSSFPALTQQGVSI